VTFLLRKIRQNRWYNEYHPWLKSGDIQADPFADLNTQENCLSVWHIEDDRSNLDQVITALAASGTNLANLDYALFDRQILDKLFNIKKTPGGSHDSIANSSWHHDLTELSGLKLVQLAKSILENSQRVRVQEKVIAQLIAKAIASGRIKKDKVNKKIVEKIESLPP